MLFNYFIFLNILNKLILRINIYYLSNFMGIGDWGLGIGDWGLGPIPNPQSPIPNPQSPTIFKKMKYLYFKYIKF